MLKNVFQFGLAIFLVVFLQACGFNADRPKETKYSKARDYCSSKVGDSHLFTVPTPVHDYEVPSHEADAKAAIPIPPILKESFADCMMDWRFDDLEDID